MLIDFSRKPSRRDIVVLGIALVPSVAVLGFVLGRTVGRPAGEVAWAVGAVLVGVYWFVPGAPCRIHAVTMAAVWPIGLVFSVLIVTVVYYVVFTPAGLFLRLTKRDAMGRRTKEPQTSYWIEREPSPESERYFRQF